MITDNFGAVCQPREYGKIECGDAAAWTGPAIYLGKNVLRKVSFEDFFSVGFGAYVRHPFAARTDNGFGAYYKNPWDGCISRDQLTGILLATIGEKNYLGGLKIVIHHLAWLMLFTYNTRSNGKDPSMTPWKWPDPTGPDIWAMEIRAMGPWAAIPLWPLLCVFDLHTLVNGIFDRFSKNDDVISFAAKYMTTLYNYPTITSLFVYLVVDRKSMLKRLKEYWCGWRSQPEMYQLYWNKLGSAKYE